MFIVRQIRRANEQALLLEGLVKDAQKFRDRFDSWEKLAVATIAQSDQAQEERVREFFEAFAPEEYETALRMLWQTRSTYAADLRAGKEWSWARQLYLGDPQPERSQYGSASEKIRGRVGVPFVYWLLREAVARKPDLSFSAEAFTSSIFSYFSSDRPHGGETLEEGVAADFFRLLLERVPLNELNRVEPFIRESRFPGVVTTLIHDVRRRAGLQPRPLHTSSSDPLTRHLARLSGLPDAVSEQLDSARALLAERTGWVAELSDSLRDAVADRLPPADVLFEYLMLAAERGDGQVLERELETLGKVVTELRQTVNTQRTHVLARTLSSKSPDDLLAFLQGAQDAFEDRSQESTNQAARLRLEGATSPPHEEAGDAFEERYAHE